MKTVPLFLSLMFFGLVFASCKKIDYANSFEKSYQEWMSFKKTSGNSYRYTVLLSSWVGLSWQTVITVSDGKVIQRSYKVIPTNGVVVDIPVDEREWIENGDEVNTHENTPAANTFTLDRIYDEARSNWLKKRSNSTTYFEAKNNGLISSCGYSDNDCVDDCFTGITIISIKPF